MVDVVKLTDNEVEDCIAKARTLINAKNGKGQLLPLIKNLFLYHVSSNNNNFFHILNGNSNVAIVTIHSKTNYVVKYNHKDDGSNSDKTIWESIAFTTLDNTLKFIFQLLK